MIQIRFHRDLSMMGQIAMWIRDYDPATRKASPCMDPIVFKQDVDPMFMIEPNLRLEEDEAIAVMDSLWSAGVRPSEVSNPSETVNAHKEHIDSLNRVVERTFSLLESRDSTQNTTADTL